MQHQHSYVRVLAMKKMPELGDEMKSWVYKIWLCLRCYNQADIQDTGCTYFFCWEVVRRVHRNAPTTTTMMVKAPTEIMMIITKMLFSLAPVKPVFPEKPQTQKHQKQVNVIFSRDTTADGDL